MGNYSQEEEPADRPISGGVSTNIAIVNVGDEVEGHSHAVLVL